MVFRLLVERRALGTWVSVAEHVGTSSWGAQALLVHGVWNLPGPGIESVSPALAGGFLSSSPPGKSLYLDRVKISTNWECFIAAAAKSLQSCPTLCDPIDGSPPGSPIPGILQARTLEWVAIAFSSAGKWKVKVKSLSLVRLLATPWTAAHQAPPPMGFSRQEYWSGVPLSSPMLHRGCDKWGLTVSQVNEVGLRGNILLRRNRMLRGKGEKQYYVCQDIYCVFTHILTVKQFSYLRDQRRKSGNIVKLEKELPWCLSGEESACRCQGHGFNPWSRKIPHATKLLSHNCWACALESGSHNYWSLCTLQPVLRSKRGCRSEKPTHHN